MKAPCLHVGDASMIFWSSRRIVWQKNPSTNHSKCVEEKIPWRSSKTKYNAHTHTHTLELNISASSSFDFFRTISFATSPNAGRKNCIERSKSCWVFPFKKKEILSKKSFCEAKGLSTPSEARKNTFSWPTDQRNMLKQTRVTHMIDATEISVMSLSCKNIKQAPETWLSSFTCSFLHSKCCPCLWMQKTRVGPVNLSVINMACEFFFRSTERHHEAPRDVVLTHFIGEVRMVNELKLTTRSAQLGYIGKKSTKVVDHSK